MVMKKEDMMRILFRLITLGFIVIGIGLTGCQKKMTKVTPAAGNNAGGYPAAEGAGPSAAA